MLEVPFYENLLNCSTAFKPETGALLLFRAGRVQLYKGGWQPMAMEKSAANPRWVFNRGGGLLNLRTVHEQVRRYRGEQARAAAAGEAQKRPLRYQLECLDRFLETIPDELMNQLRRLRGRSWPMYSFLARCAPAATEMATTNLACAFCVGNAWVFATKGVRWEMRRSRALLRKPRKVILERLGFPGAEAAVRALGRVVDDSVDVRPLLFLRDAMADPAVLRRLSHIPRINAGVIRIISEPHLLPVASPGLLAEAGRARAFDVSGADLSRLLGDTMAMLQGRSVRPLERALSWRGLAGQTVAHEQEAMDREARAEGCWPVGGQWAVDGGLCA